MSEVDTTVQVQAQVLRSLKDTELGVTIIIVEDQMPIGQLTSLVPGSIVHFDHNINDPVHLSINGKRFCTGTVVQVGEKYGFEIKDILE